MISEYPIAFEISATMGLFSRIDCGSLLMTESFPTASAIEGLIKSVFWKPNLKVEIDVVAIGICNKPKYTSSNFNSTTSPIRKSEAIKDDNATQIISTSLINPCYHVLAILKSNVHGNDNHAHAFQERFLRRLIRNQSFHTLFMGVKDCQLDYIGNFTTPIIDYEQDIPSMFYRFDYSTTPPSRICKNNLKVRQGILKINTDYEVVKTENGIMNFRDFYLQKKLDNYLTALSNGKCRTSKKKKKIKNA